MSLRQDLITVANSLTSFSAHMAAILKAATVRRLQTPPPLASGQTAYAVGTRWQEILSNGLNKYAWLWVWDGSNWIAENYFIAVSISTSRLTGNSGTYRTTLSLTNNPGVDTVKVVNPQIVCAPDGTGSTWSIVLSTIATAGTVVPWLSSAIAPNNIAQSPLTGLGANGQKIKTVPLMSPAQSLLTNIMEIEAVVTRNSGNASAITVFRCNLHPVRS
jgi:hypothetical protein